MKTNLLALAFGAALFALPAAHAADHQSGFFLNGHVGQSSIDKGAYDDDDTAFGANLLGAMFGGVLEYLALITGYRFLVVVVAVLYGIAFLTGRRHLGATT